MTETTEPKSERVDLRMTPAAKRTLQRAAAVNAKTLTEFVLDSSLTAAFDTLADRRVFQLDEVQCSRRGRPGTLSECSGRARAVSAGAARG